MRRKAKVEDRLAMLLLLLHLSLVVVSLLVLLLNDSLPRLFRNRSRSRETPILVRSRSVVDEAGFSDIDVELHRRRVLLRNRERDGFDVSTDRSSSGSSRRRGSSDGLSFVHVPSVVGGEVGSSLEKRKTAKSERGQLQVSRRRVETRKEEKRKKDSPRA